MGSEMCIRDRNQLVEKEGKPCDLWADFKKHSKLYMAHHAKAKWQTNSHGLCLSTFQDGDVVIETDFTEKYSHVPGGVLTCAKHPQTTLMVAIVHFSPQQWEGGRKGSPGGDIDFCFRGPCPRLRLPSPRANSDRRLLLGWARK